MNREIIFRAKRVDNGEWVYGDLITKPVHHECVILENGVIHHAVDPATVGQLLPLKDANGSNVFEEDIVRGERTPDNPMTNYLDISPATKRTEYRVVKFVVSDDSVELYLPKSISYSERLPHNYIHWVVVGNIFDTPELIPENG